MYINARGCSTHLCLCSGLNRWLEKEKRCRCYRHLFSVPLPWIVTSDSQEEARWMNAISVAPWQAWYLQPPMKMKDSMSTLDQCQPFQQNCSFSGSSSTYQMPRSPEAKQGLQGHLGYLWRFSREFSMDLGENITNTFVPSVLGH